MPERGHFHFPYLRTAANHVCASCYTRMNITPNPSASKCFFIIFTVQRRVTHGVLCVCLQLPFQSTKPQRSSWTSTQPAFLSLAATWFSCSSSSSFFLRSFRRYSSGSIPASRSSDMAFSNRCNVRALCTFRAVMYNVNSLKPISLQVSTSQIFLTSLVLSTWGKKTKPDIFSRSSILTSNSLSWWLKPMGLFGTTKAPSTKGSVEVLLRLARITLYRWDGTATSSFPITCQKEKFMLQISWEGGEGDKDVTLILLLLKWDLAHNYTSKSCAMLSH